MRHKIGHRKLQRTSSHRKALLRNLATSLVLYDHIKTTEAKAKALRPFVERLITRARTPTLANRRILLRELETQGSVRKALEVLGPRYKERAGGYTRIVHLGTRRGDAARMASIEFV